MNLNDSIKNAQPILYQVLWKSFSNNKIPHAFLLVGTNSSQYAHYIAKALLCEKSILACDNCTDCHRVDDHTYGDLLYYSGRNESIKKSQIEFIQQQFSKSSLEGKEKIYILEDIENSSSEAMNSLLKVLEEPVPGVYAIFTCKNINRVLSTIQSRCQIIQLLPQSKQLLKKQLKEKDIPLDDLNVLSELFDDYNTCKDLIESEKFDNLKNEVYHFMNDLYFHRDNLIINVQTHLLKDYNDKDSIRLFLNMLVLSFKDLFHVKHSIDLTYPSFKSLYEKIDDDSDTVINKINLILETEFLLNTNANLPLLMDSLMIRL